jgi:nucleotide-binding universal stress UspA family protein
MIQRILLATEGSEGADQAIRFLGGLGLPSSTTVQVTCVVDQFIESLLEEVKPPTGRDFAHRVVEEAVTRLAADGLQACYQIRRGDSAHQVILAADAFDADLIVVGSRGLTGLASFVLGSVARDVAQHSTRSVLVVRGSEGAPSEVVLALDDSNQAARGLELAGWLPRAAAVTAVNVVRPAHPLLGLAAIQDAGLFDRLHQAEERSRAAGEKLVAEAAARLQAAGKQTRTEVRHGDPASEILTVCEERKAGLLIAGARGRSPLNALVLGSVADRLLRAAPCSLLLAR